MRSLPSQPELEAAGPRGAAATAHPLATRAAASILGAGGSAVDAAIAAQAVICVAMPQAAGLGGDVLALVHEDGAVHAVNGTGCSPRRLTTTPPTTGGGAVTVPGLVDGWLTLHRNWGRLPLSEALEPAWELALSGLAVEPALTEAVGAQRPRLLAGGAAQWGLLQEAEVPSAGGWIQTELGSLLHRVAGQGRNAFYSGAAAEAVAAAVRRCGGTLDTSDLAAHRTLCPAPVAVTWKGRLAHVQPPASQGVLLAMALRKVAALADAGAPVDDHVLVEVTEAAFAYRSSCGRGAALLEEELDIDLERASHRGGPRSYLHTAGVATVDAREQVVSSLVSVFDDFGSGVFVPELGIVLNNRAAGFTDGDNATGPAKRPVHTLAPAMVTGPEHGVLALATPGADGQVQTLLQVLVAAHLHGRGVQDAVRMARWRSEDGRLLVEEGHPAADDLAALGHEVVLTPPGADVFGAVVAAGVAPGSGVPFAIADWRRQTTSQGVT